MTATPDSEAQAVRQRLRQHWLAVLARADRATLERSVDEAALPQFTWLRAPQIGMLMLRARAGGTGAPFNLGEATVTRCSLRCERGFVGTGIVLGRDRARATAVARLDAALQDPARTDALMRSVIAPLQQAQNEGRRMAAHAAATSRVEFFTVVRGS